MQEVIAELHYIFIPPVIVAYARIIFTQKFFHARGNLSTMNLKQLFLYGIFGVLTTLINIAAYWLCTRMLYVPVVPSTVIAWLVAVFFAYYTNRTYVFHSTTSSLRGVISEAAEFFACRIATGVIDVIIMYVFVNVLNFDDVFIKTASNILVIILNYIASKLFIFSKANEH